MGIIAGIFVGSVGMMWQVRGSHSYHAVIGAEVTMVTIPSIPSTSCLRTTPTDTSHTTSSQLNYCLYKTVTFQINMVTVLKHLIKNEKVNQLFSSPTKQLG